ncbi:Arginine transport system permease protein ArtQ [Haploplasma axanthum]|uniref:Arginine transport system permease protein ArtQ n=1 Tax=Haploplasma axanthum TaxID=29552 RepID=A0A449BC85_HAPAX|nr:Arginine transport system permease protein ArtQ [Haploplasma axanthum]
MYTILLAVLGTVGGFLLALPFLGLKTAVIDYKRDSKLVQIFKRLGIWFANIYTTFFRGTPMMVQAMILYYGMSLVILNLTGYNQWWKPLIAAIIVIIMNTTAYIIEILRGAVNSIDEGQMEAARSLGFSRKKTLYLIIYPQAIKNALPSIGNEFIVNLKDSSVLSVIGIFDLFKAAGSTASKTADSVTPYFIIAVIYLILTSLTALLVKKLESKRNGGVKNVW